MDYILREISRELRSNVKTKANLEHKPPKAGQNMMIVSSIACLIGLWIVFISLSVAGALAGEAKVLAFDLHHCNAEQAASTNWPNSVGDLSKYAVGKGWQTRQIDVEPVTSQYLRKEGISILCIQYNKKVPYTEKEIGEIVQFVKDGGGLLIQADHPAESYSKEILVKFGIRVSDQGLTENTKVTVSSDHPLMKDVTTFSLKSEGANWYRSMYLAITHPAYEVLSAGKTEPYKPVIAAVEHGKGRVVVYPNGFFMTLMESDNSYFLRNALYWLQRITLP